MRYNKLFLIISTCTLDLYYCKKFPLYNNPHLQQCYSLEHILFRPIRVERDHRGLQLIGGHPTIISQEIKKFKRQSAGLYVTVRLTDFTLEHGRLFQEQGMKPFLLHPEDHSITYYKWITGKKAKDMIPEPVTSIAGVCGYVVAKNQRGTHSVLLAVERGQWKCISGHVDIGENDLQSLLRELREEINLRLYRNDFIAYLVGGYSEKNGSPWGLNDRYTAFVIEVLNKNRLESVKSTSEVGETRWFEVTWLMSFDESNPIPGRTSDGRVIHAKLASDVKEAIRGFQTKTCLTISNHKTSMDKRIVYVPCKSS